MTSYYIEYWDPSHKRYVRGTKMSEKWANIMMYKSYNRIHTRRLVKITKEIIIKVKGEKK